MSSIVGIDLGTTNSGVARYTAMGIAEMATGGDGCSRTFPSAVYVDRSGAFTIGQEAKAAAIFAPERVALFFKRSMGSSLAALAVDGTELSPEELSAILMRGLLEETEGSLDGKPFRTVISVPAYFHNVHREATARAGVAAGLDVLATINEPTAAALAYAQRKPDLSGVLLVYDLGGGTFDATLVDYSARDIAVVASTGNHSLGGKDWDDALLSLVADRVQAAHGVDLLDDAVALADLRARCEQLKWTLSIRESARIAIDALGVRETIVVSRGDFEACTAHLLDQTRSLLKDLFIDAGMDWRDVGATLLVGGSTRMPAVSALTQRLSGRAPLADLNPDEAVALGAAIRAGQLVGRAHGLSSGAPAGLMRTITDVTPHSLGYVQITADGTRYACGLVLKKNTPLPASEVRPGDVRTTEGADNSFEVIVMQGDAERVLDNELVAAYTVSGIPHRGGETTVDVSFGYDFSGFVRVTATDRVSGVDLVVTPSEADDLLWTDGDPNDQVGSASVDVVFVIDTSGSMGGEIEGVKKSCVDFAEFIEHEGANVRLGVVGFGIGSSTLEPPNWRIHRGAKYTFADMVLTDPVQFKAAMREFTLCCCGGSGCYVAERETLEVFDAAFSLFDDEVDAARMVILISDEMGSSDALEDIVAHAHACRATVHVMGLTGVDRAHEALARAAGGQFWNISASAGHDFSDLLGQVAGEIARSIAREHGGGGLERRTAGFHLSR